MSTRPAAPASIWPPAGERFRPRLALRRAVGRVFLTAFVALSLLAVVVLGVLLYRVFSDGWSMLSLKFLQNYPSVLEPEEAGIHSAVLGTIWLITITALVAVPIGVGAAVWLEEYAPHNALSRFIHLNIANLAGVPSIVYGILGLAVFVRWLQYDRSILAGALTMSLLILPVIIIAAREALSAVPNSIREAAYALGATRWQVVRYHVLPAAAPGVMTGVILALSRAIGEAAPLILIGALTYVAFAPSGPFDQFTVLPVQIFDWSDRPQPEFQRLAAATSIVLLGVLLSMNAVAIGIRAWRQRQS